jgi:hypothetical protein
LPRWTQPVDATPLHSNPPRWNGMHMEGHARTRFMPQLKAKRLEGWKSCQYWRITPKPLEERERCLMSWLLMEKLLRHQQSVRSSEGCCVDRLNSPSESVRKSRHSCPICDGTLWTPRNEPRLSERLTSRRSKLPIAICSTSRAGLSVAASTALRCNKSED